MCSSSKSTITSLRNDDVLEDLVAEAHGLHSSVPIRLQRPADAEEEADEDGGEEYQTTDQGVHGNPHLASVLNAQEEQTDADLGEHQGDVGLDPVGPAERGEQTPLRPLQVIAVSTEAAGDDFGADKASAYNGRDLGLVNAGNIVRVWPWRRTMAIMIL